MQNGKGSKWRKSTNYKDYFSNYDSIFRKKAPKTPIKELTKDSLVKLLKDIIK
jgi:hypothetical protein